MNKKISVIIPMYNSEAYIKRTLKSIVNQTLSVFEIIIIDDCSNDNCVAVASDYLKTTDLSYKVLINESNSGPSFSRNRGIEEAKGDYILFVDSDDLIVPFYIEHFVLAFEKYNYDFVFCRAYTCDNNIDVNSFSDEFVVSDFQYEYRYSIVKRHGFSWGALFNTQIIKEHNIRFHENCNYMEDNLFNYDYLKYVNSVGYVKSAVYCYIEYSGSLSHPGDKKILINKTKKTQDFFEKNTDITAVLKDKYECTEFIKFRRYFINTMFGEMTRSDYGAKVINQKYVYPKSIYFKIILRSSLKPFFKIGEILLQCSFIERMVYRVWLKIRSKM